MSVSSAPPLVLASISPQRRMILEQLRIPFDAVAPDYEEVGDDPVEHAAGKARSVDGGDRRVLGVDTIVVCDGRTLGKPADATDAGKMIETLSGKTQRSSPASACALAPGRNCTARSRASASARSPPATSRRIWRAASGRTGPADMRSRDSAPAS